MDDIPEKLRQYYAAQSLSPEAVARILTLSRTERVKRQRLLWCCGLAAALLLATGFFSNRFLRFNQRVELAAVEVGVQTFFTLPVSKLDQLSSDPNALRTWLIQEGAPQGFNLPTALAALPSVGCKILQIENSKVFIICFALPPEVSIARPAASLSSSSSAPMAAKPMALVHLVIVPTSSLRDPPGEANPLRLETRNQWAYATWTHSEVTYIAASTVGADQLKHALRKS